MATAAEWSKRIEHWQSTGEDPETYATGRGWKPGTFKWWIYHLNKNKQVPAVRLVQVQPSCATEPPEDTKVTPPSARRTAFEPVLAAQPSPVTHESSLVIELRSQLRIRVSPGFDPDLLRGVLKVLEAM